MSASRLAPAYIVAARRTALGRIGGLHRNRRLEDLAAPVVGAALADAGIAPGRVEELILGNATAGGNPARLVALAAGLPETVAASTIDCQCASGLEAILAGIRSVGAGNADVVVAGGADSVSTAPWRIAKPKSLYQLPQFIAFDPGPLEAGDAPQAFTASEVLAKRFGISRQAQDDYALETRLRAVRAREQRRFLGEIVPLRANPEEARDQSAVDADREDLTREVPFDADAGTVTPGNASFHHDGAAFVVIVSGETWARLGEPPGLRLVASASNGVGAGEDAASPIAAMEKLYRRLNGFDRSALAVVEMSESSAAQALAFITRLGLDPGLVNPDGGAIARGHPFGASGAVIVTRLFTRLARQRNSSRPSFGAAVQGAAGGLGLAALFEAV